MHVKEVLSDTPIALLVGPRRVGKTTLAKKFTNVGYEFISFDNVTSLDAARTDPEGFVRGLNRVVIDEIQRAPDVLLSIKRSVDEVNQPGQFLLTGSANVLTLPRIADSLVGRMETIQMLPLAKSEIEGNSPSFLECLFEGEVPCVTNPIIGDELVSLVLSGGYPEMRARANERRRLDWARAYLTTALARDLHEIADVQKLTELPNFLRLVAEHSGQLINYAKFGASINVSHITSQRYIGLLEQIFLVKRLQPWFTSSLKRIVKTPKLHFLDSGLLSGALGLTAAKVKSDRNKFGAVLECFVLSEILKLISFSNLRITPHHYRNRDLREVDIVLERDDGAVVGVEVKSRATIRSGDFAGLKDLANTCGDRFVYGVVLYDGTDVVSFGERYAAVPLAALWH